MIFLINAAGLLEFKSDSPIRKFLIPVLSLIYFTSFSFLIPLSDMIGPLWLLTVSKIEIVLLIEISKVFKFLLLIPIKASLYFKAFSASFWSWASIITLKFFLMASS